MIKYKAKVLDLIKLPNVEYSLPYEKKKMLRERVYFYFTLEAKEEYMLAI